MTAKQAGEKLARCSQGTYLVRFSANSYGCFVISVLRGTTCANFTVQRQDGKYVYQHAYAILQCIMLIMLCCCCCCCCCHAVTKQVFAAERRAIRLNKRAAGKRRSGLGRQSTPSGHAIGSSHANLVYVSGSRSQPRPSVLIE